MPTQGLSNGKETSLFVRRSTTVLYLWYPVPIERHDRRKLIRYQNTQVAKEPCI